MASTVLFAPDQMEDIDRYYRLVANGVLDRVLGSISVGKEANIVRAEKDGHEGAIRYFALKIYKSSMMTFRKSRSKYVDPDSSFRKVYHGANPRTLVKEWARKEVRNLKKLNNEGIPSPEPILVKRNVVLMTFVGSDTGSAAPLLANTKLSEAKLSQLYRDLVEYIRRMYVKCRIVHADLSEFNILYHDGKPYIIDVSQAVSLSHPYTQMFLRKDCRNVTDYFRKKGVATMPLDDLLDFVTDSNATEDNVDDLVQDSQDGAINHSLTDRTGEDVVDELEPCYCRGGSLAKKILDKRPKNETTEERKERKHTLKQTRREKLQTADTYSVKARKAKAAHSQLSPRVCVESSRVCVESSIE